jgi:hypothetical protein
VLAYCQSTLLVNLDLDLSFWYFDHYQFVKSKFMKTLKNISIFILLIGFAFALIQCNKDNLSVKPENDNSIELRTYSEDCLPPLEDGCSQKNDTIHITISQFPGCVFIVNVNVQKCPDGMNSWTYNIGDFTILSHDCPAFDSIILNSNQQYLENFTYQFGVWVRNALTNHYLIQDIQPNGGTYAIINHYFASCLKTCYIEIWEDPKWPRLVYYGIQRERCGENCCQLETDYQYINGNWMLQSQRSYGPSEPCSESSTAVCGIGTVRSTPCTAQCGGPEM